MSDQPPIATRARPGPIRRLLRAGGACVVLLAVAIGIGACMNVGERMAYHPSRDVFATPPGVEDLSFESADGTTLHAWFMPAAGTGDEPGPVIVHAHGNAGNLADHAGFSSFLREHGFHVLLFDYRGYGRSGDARPTRAKLIEDTRAALSEARHHPLVNPDRVGLYGVSLGGAFALPVAAEDQGVRAVATLAAFSTWRGVASDWVPLIGPALIRAGREPRAAAADLGERPYLIVHGDADRVINVRHAALLRDAAQSAGVDTTVEIVPGAGHNAILETNPEARETIASFFATHLEEAPSP